MLLNSIFLILLVFAIASFGRDIPCANYNNNCGSCIQNSNDGKVPVHNCLFCPVDGICHTIGSAFNKCSHAECVSLSTASKCEKKTLDSCNALVNFNNSDIKK